MEVVAYVSFFLYVNLGSNVSIGNTLMHVKLILLLIIWQRDTNGLTSENSELKLRLQTMEQQVHLQDGKGPPWIF
jgi:hypothetical protein